MSSQCIPINAPSLFPQEQATSISFDPRIEDVKALYELYQKVFFPFINHDSSWVSGVALYCSSYIRMQLWLLSHSYLN